MLKISIWRNVPQANLHRVHINPELKSSHQEDQDQREQNMVQDHFCLLCAKTNVNLTSYELNDPCKFLDKWFNEEGYPCYRFYQFKQAMIKEVLPLYGSTVLQGVTLLLCTQANMTAIFRGSLCTDCPENESKGTLSFGCYNPPSKEVIKKIEDNKNKTLIDNALDQEPQHCNKKNTNIHRLYYIKDKEGIITITKNYAAEIVFYSKTKLTKNRPYDVMDLPSITWALHNVILYLQDQSGGHISLCRIHIYTAQF